MKRTVTVKGLPALLLIGFIIALFAVAIGPTIYGAYLAFKASLILGIVVLVVEPAPMVLGWIAIFGHPEVAQKIAQWIGLPF